VTSFSDSRPTGAKYEPPRALRLSDAETGVGSVCRHGIIPNASCQPLGSGAQGACQAFGYSADPRCNNGYHAAVGCTVGGIAGV
jgi:hypothetical protein